VASEPVDDYVPTFTEDLADVGTWAIVIICFAVVIGVTFGFVGYLASFGSLTLLVPIAALFWLCRYGEVPTHTIYNDDTIGTSEGK
jgi:hypothetical protein